MAGSLGSFCLVLHAHLPYVLNHGLWPHGEDWLFEAAAETYLPVLKVIDEIHRLGGRPGFTIGITPVLLEQLGHEQFKARFVDYLKEFTERAEVDAREFSSRDDENSRHMARLANDWARFFGENLEQFESIDRDIPAAFAERARQGSIEILSSNATHAYMPLLAEDSAIRGQLRAGLATSRKHLGFTPTGVWLPECAYRPGGPWTPPVAWTGHEYRPGTERFLADEGVDHFFVENHLIEHGRSEGLIDEHGARRVGWDEGAKYPGRGWYSVNEPVWVASDGQIPDEAHRVAAFARDPRICEQVWSGSVGYPAHEQYLEFHRKHGAKRGLRYWRITGKSVELGDKHLYNPDAIQGLVHEHAQHFCDQVRDRLARYRERTGRPGMVMASFDTELFGHWWFEGPRFIQDMLLTLHHDPQIDVITTAERMQQAGPDKVMTLPEGSWGEGGDHRVWINEETKWMWEVEYRCEAAFGRLTFSMPWQKDAKIRRLLEAAGRELLLLQASDWPFVISRGQAIDYGIKRFVLHTTRFENLCDLVEKVHAGGELDEKDQAQLAEAELHDVIFQEIDLNWWNA